MKKILCTFALVAAAVAAFYLSSFHAAAQSTPDGSNAVQTIEADSQKTQEEYRASLKRSEETRKAQTERIDALLTAQEASHARAEALLAKQEKMIERQATDIERYEKILGTWEKQQKQYQKYLDSLAK